MFYDVMSRMCSYLFRQFYLQNGMAYSNFLTNRTKIDTGEAVSLIIDACKLIRLYLQPQRPVISNKLQPLSPLMPTPNRFRSKVCIRKTHMLSAFSNEPPHRIGSGVPLKPYLCTCKWLCGARLNEILAGLHHLLATPGMPSRRCSRSMDRADVTSKARGNEVLTSGDISRRDANHTHE